jgi:hypothetical protein
MRVLLKTKLLEPLERIAIMQEAELRLHGRTLVMEYVDLWEPSTRVRIELEPSDVAALVKRFLEER